MKIGIMQSYLFPYIGYFQLMNLSDIFVLHDDVQYIKGGWINRNRLLLDGSPYLFTFAIEKADYHLNINQRMFTDSLYQDKLKLIRFLYMNYRKAPYLESTVKLVETILDDDTRNVAEFLYHSLQTIKIYLGLTSCCILKSSDLNKDGKLHGQDRVIDIVEVLGGDHYINPIGGTELYDKQVFSDRNIKLNFIQTDFSRCSYDQFDKSFVPGLSIIDVLMFNSVEKIKEMLIHYDLL